jgi:quinolinate synthase
MNNSKMNNSKIINKILNVKNMWGDRLIILTHHYQRIEIVDLGDYRGDSFGLSQKAAADKVAEFIIFCGVHFMAESAEILSQPHQTVQLPDLEAGCWMADMADAVIVERAWKEVTAITGEKSIVPIVYMNADAEIKAFCGRNGGLVCTSSNAPAAFKWGLEQREKVFFFPDQHLGRNTANQMGFHADEMIVWQPSKPLGGNMKAEIENAKVILWDGYCLVHTRFQKDHLKIMRQTHPDAQIVVHPECTQEVVQLADAVGSTSFIVKFVETAAPGTTIIIGTEANLIKRLEIENPGKNIMPLHYSMCPNMFKINPENLLATLENLGEKNVIHVPEAVKKDARIALDRMLTLA